MKSSASGGVSSSVGCLNVTTHWNCDDFDTSGERLVGELVSEGTGERLEERLDAKLEGDEQSKSSRLLFAVFSLSQSSLMMIILVGAEVISTSSSELPSDDLMALLLSSLGTRSVNLLLLKRFFRFRHGSVRGNGGWLDDFCWCGWCTRNEKTFVGGGGGLTGAGSSMPSAMRLCSSS